jgi:hypothetical protein
MVRADFLPSRGNRLGSVLRHMSPKLVEIVIVALGFVKDMHDNVIQIEEHPFSVSVSFGIAAWLMLFRDGIRKCACMTCGRSTD